MGTSSVTIAPRPNHSVAVNTELHIIETISSPLPHYPVPIPPDMLRNIQPLADPQFNVPGPIDILLGADSIHHFLPEDRTLCPSLRAVPTKLGWVIFGPITHLPTVPPTMNVAAVTRLASPLTEGSSEEPSIVDAQECPSYIPINPDPVLPPITAACLSTSAQDTPRLNTNSTASVDMSGSTSAAITEKNAPMLLPSNAAQGNLVQIDSGSPSSGACGVSTSLPPRLNTNSAASVDMSGSKSAAHPEKNAPTLLPSNATQGNLVKADSDTPAAGTRGVSPSPPVPVHPSPPNRSHTSQEAATGQTTATGSASTKNQPSDTTELEMLLKKFWLAEDPAPPTAATADESERLYQSTTSRLPNGRYMVQIPFKDGAVIGYSNKLARPPVGPARAYGYYIPHHAVDPKFRVVFNASAETTTGQSLNDIQHKESRVQDVLLYILMRFRQYPIAVTADVEKMFRQILVDPEHRRWQQVLWRENPEDELIAYELNTVTYGMASSPFVAVRTLKQCAMDNRDSIPDESRAEVADTL